MLELKLLRDLLIVQDEQIILKPEIVAWSVEQFGHVKIDVRKFPVEHGSPLVANVPHFRYKPGTLILEAKDSYGIVLHQWAHDGTGYLKGEYDYATAHMFFENERDLIYFKLRWFG